MTTDAFPPGTDGHPAVEDISALTEGLLAPEAAERLRAHLGDCALCADVHASLEEIRGALGTLPGPAPMPAELAGRIDAALAAEALLDATAVGPPGRGVSRETATSSPHRSSPTPAVSRETGASDRPPGRPQAATGPGRPRTRRSRRRTALATAACAVVALGLGGVLAQQTLTDDGSDPAKTTRASAQDARLEHHVQHLLAAARTSPSTKQGPSTPAQGSGQAPSAPVPLAGGGPTSVPTCIREGIHRTQMPLAVDERATYRGKPVYLVVLPHPGDRQRVDAYLVDPACTTGADSGPGRVLLTRTYPRS